MGLIRNYLDNVLAAIKSDGSATEITATDAGDLNTNINTLISGENQSHNTSMIEHSNPYVTVTLNTGGNENIENTSATAGDTLVAIYFDDTIPEDIIIKDGSNERFTIPSPQAGQTWVAPGGGVQASTYWAIKQTTSSTATIICLGYYE